jgi:hypothetical protein
VDEVSATVVLRTAGSGLPAADITADHAELFQPRDTAVVEVTRWFDERGFQVGGVLGPAFAITGPAGLFEDTFGTADPAVPPTVDRLPPEIARHLDAVVFTAPPDFGPGNP